jgi:hypothetical protein
MEKKTIYSRLLEAKSEIGKVTKNANNPHFKKSYADINAIIETVEPVLIKHGLVLIQPIESGNVVTRIIDAATGEVLESAMPLSPTANPQQMGSQITYYRRYTLQSLLSLQAEDDDANAASAPQAKTKPAKETFTNKNFEKAFAANASIERIKQLYTLTPEVEKEWIQYVLDKSEQNGAAK